jgi:chromosome segregation ATPase
LQELQAEVASLRSQPSVERSETRQLEVELKNQRGLLAVKEKALAEVKLHLATQPDDLEASRAMIAALVADEDQWDQYTAEIERLHGQIAMLEEALHAKEQTLEASTNRLDRLQQHIKTLNEELRKKDLELHTAQPSASDIPDFNRATEATLELLQQPNRDLRREKKLLQSDLEQEQENVKKALEIAASSVASRSTKRSRIKEDPDEESDDLVRASDAAMKRARQENIREANANPQVVIGLD